MATLPEASVTINDAAGGLAGATGYEVVLACVEKNADLTPRVFASTSSILAQHGYAPGVDYVAQKIDATKLPVIFVALPTVTAGVLGRQNATGVLGSSVISIAAGSAGFLEETVSSIVVVNSGTIGASGITFNYSADGGFTNKLIRLGTASSYTVPYLGIVINFAAGTLLAGDTYTFTTTAPMWDSAGMAAARIALASQLKLARSFMVVGDLANSTFAGYVTTAVNAYETTTDRYVYARAQVRDQLPLAAKSKILKTMTGSPSITFAAATTATRATGSFIADGFLVGDVVTITGTASNNFTKAITALTATVMTFASGVVNEGPIGTVVMTGSEGLVFTTTTCTRSTGSWLSDGFRVGDTATFTGTASNNFSPVITVLTATVMTFASGGGAETIGSANVTCTKGETMAAYVSLMDTGFASVDAQKRIDLGLGRLRAPSSPIHAWQFRRPVQWAASIREYQHDVQIPCWRKADAPLSGWSLQDSNGNVVEYDERVNGGALAARFTCARTYSNGPVGPFIAMSLTRATEGSLLSYTHNMAVANIACTVTHAATEQAIGQTPDLDDAGHATDAALGVIEEAVNTALQAALLQAGREGPRASKATWRASRTDLLNVVNATLTGVLDLELNGTIVNIDTTVKVH